MPRPPKHNASSKRHGYNQNYEQCGGLNPRNRRNAEGHHESEKTDLPRSDMDAGGNGTER